MRTLKKVLALSLVFAMAFTMMAGAAFKDQDKIDSALTNDIQLLTALGVFQGDENGNFNPTDNVKRSEAAKMIYVLKNNGVDDGAVAFQGVSKYSDVPVGHWAEGYINYCTNLGYMGGWQENGVQKFDPNGNVTGVELMKMLLCMIGYKADVQGYTGNGWQTNVLVDAATSGLSTNFVPSVYGATPRQWTARLMTNALDAKYVTYSKGELTYADVSYGEEFLGLRTVEGILTATNSNKLGTTVNSISSSLNESETVTVDAFTGDDLIAVGDADDNLLGQPVKAYYKKAGTTTEPKLYAVLPYAKNLKVVNTTIDAIKYDSSVKTTVTIDGLGKMDYTKSTVDSDNNSGNGVDKKISLYMNNVLVKNDTIDQLASYLDCNDSRAVTVVANKDGYAQTILVDDLTFFAQVNKIDAAKNTLTFKNVSGKLYTQAGNKNQLVGPDGTTPLTFDNSANKDNFNKYLNVASNVKDGSVVKITANTSTGKLVYDITLADKVEGTPTGYTLEDADTYKMLTINGTEYKIAHGDNGLRNYNWDTDGTIAKDKVFYTDGKYVIFSEGGTTSVSVDNLAYITATNKTEAWGKATYSVKALLSDGTVGEYVVANTYDEAGVKIAKATSVATITGSKSIYTNAAQGITGDDMTTGNGENRYQNDSDVTDALNHLYADHNAVDKIFAYSISDGKITLKALKSDTDPAGVQFDGGEQAYVNNNKTVVVTNSVSTTSDKTYKLADNAYFFVKAGTGNDAKYSVVKASELSKDQAKSSKLLFAYKNVSGIPSVLFGTLNVASSLSAADAKYAFVKSPASYALVNGKHTVQMTVADTKGEDVVIKKVYSDLASADAAITSWNALRGKVVTYTVNNDGYVVEEAPEKVAAGTANTLTANKWNQMEIEGWSSTIANVKVGSADAALVKVASDVKIHYVDATSNTNYAVLTSGSTVEKTVTDTQMSAYAYVQNINGVDTITDIFVEVNGAQINLW